MYKISYQILKEEADVIKDYYKCIEYPNDKNQYLYFQAKDEEVDISCYINKKNFYRIIYISNNKEKLKMIVSQFKRNITNNDIVDSNNQFILTTEQIGSDEVGKGDFFLGLFVVASYFKPEQIDILNELKITDSKHISDDRHLEIGKILIEKFKHYSVYITPTKLTNAHQSGLTINKVLALTHNFAHKKLLEKYNLSSNIEVFVDQFEPESSYRRDVKDMMITNKVYFHTQGEIHYPSVAISSCIARYLFLIEWEKMENKLNMKIPKGCNNDVIKSYNILKKKYSQDTLNSYVKMFFSTYQNTK